MIETIIMEMMTMKWAPAFLFYLLFWFVWSYVDLRANNKCLVCAFGAIKI